MGRILQIAKHFKRTGKPVYLMGHSFGPLVIQELLYRHPDLVRAAFYFSPSSLSRSLHSRYLTLMNSPEVTNSLEFKSDPNPDGIRFADGFAEQALSNKDVPQKTPARVFISAGDQDLWSSPDEIHESARSYPNAEVLSLRGVKHSEIFKHQEAGTSERFMPRLMADAIGEIQNITLNRREGSESAVERARFYHRNSSLFRDWVKSEGISFLTLGASDRKAALIIEEFKEFYKRTIFSAAKARESLATDREREILRKPYRDILFPEWNALIRLLDLPAPQATD